MFGLLLQKAGLSLFLTLLYSLLALEVAMPSVATLRAHLESSLPESLSSTLLMRERAAPLMVSSGVAAIDALTGGLPRGALTEISGPDSSGRTGVMMTALAGATHRQEMCVLVDASDSFDPASAMTIGVDLDRLLWVRCNDMPRRKSGALSARLGRLEQVLKVTDLLLQAGGFGMVVLDLGDIAPKCARRVPLTSWFRFRRAVEPTATVLLLVEQEPCAKTCASLVVRLEREAVCAHEIWTPRKGERVVAGGESGVPGNNAVSHAALLRGMWVRAEMVRCSAPSRAQETIGWDTRWMQRKPVQPAGVNFELRATW